nr:PepSY domain-containing protein [Azospirillum picis]
MTAPSSGGSAGGSPEKDGFEKDGPVNDGSRSAADRLPGLENRLFDIPEDKFVEVVRLLERVRDHPDVRETFAAIRPRLVQVRPQRRPTLKRILCLPFEDVLEGFGSAEIPPGRIERRVIEPLWRLVAECGDRHQLDQLDRQVQETAPGNRNALRNIGLRLWPMAAQAIRVAVGQTAAGATAAGQAAVGQGGSGQAVRLLHGDEDLRRQVLEVVSFLEIGPIIEALKDALSPKPLPALEPADIAAIEQAAQAAACQSPASVFPLLLVAASRLARPADLLAVMPGLDLGKARREQPAIFARLGGLVVANLEERGARLASRPDSGSGAANATASPEEAVAIAERLVAGVLTTSALIDALAEPAYRERLGSVKAAVRSMVTGTVLDTAPHGILSAVPVPSAGRPLPVDEDAQAAAEDHARALRRCEGLADALGLRQPLKDTLASMERGLLDRAHALLAQYPAAAAEPDGAETAEMALFYALRLLEMVAGPAKADRLREAIMAATGEFAEG